MRQPTCVILFLLLWFSALTQELLPVDEMCSEGKIRLNKNINKLKEAEIGSTVHDVNHLFARWTIDPVHNYISGHVKYSFAPRLVSAVVFELSPTLKIEKLLVNNQVKIFDRSGDKVVFENTDGVEVLQLDVFYSGVPRDEGLGSFTQDFHDETPIVWTLSEPFGAKDWFPAFQNLEDKIDSMDVFLEVATGNIGVSNGILQSEISNDSTGYTTYHWKHQHPIAYYLIAISATNYAQYVQHIPLISDTVLIQNFVYPEHVSSAITNLSYLEEIMMFFDSLLIPYPYANEKYGHAQFGWGGGMEHQTISFMGSFNYGLMAHELAHQWYGNLITCGTWQDIWLNEGFATYLDGLTRQYLRPEEWKGWLEDTQKKAHEDPFGSVYITESNPSVARIFSSALSYNKGAMVLHQLRFEIGDSAFFSGIRNYLINQRELGFAQTSDLQKALENSAGINLQVFFDEYVYQTGFPLYSIEWSALGNKVFLNVSQTDPFGTPKVYHHHIPVLLKGNGKEELRRVKLDSSSHFFILETDFEVNSLAFDPNNNLLGKLIREFQAGHIDRNQSIVVFPNPTANKLVRIAFRHPQNKVSLEMYNSLGKQVLKTDIDSGVSLFTIDVSLFSPGIYYVKTNVRGNENNIVPLIIK